MCDSNVESIFATLQRSTISSISGEICKRCGKKVYPVERIDVGLVFHRSCFKCKQCEIQLSLKSFQLSRDEQDVFCGNHVAIANAQINRDSLHIQQAIQSQKIFSQRPGVTPTLQRKNTFHPIHELETSGVINAQSALEENHREEEDELYRQMFDERRAQLRALDRQMQTERENAVSLLMRYFDTKQTSTNEREAIIRNLDRMLTGQRTERAQELLKLIALEEQAAVTRMIEKHSKEMFLLIHNKDRSISSEDGSSSRQTHEQTEEEVQLLADPPPAPPLSSKFDLFDSPKIFRHLDRQALRVAGQQYESFTELVKVLTANCKSDLEKVRVIFKWMSTSQITEEADPESPLGLLRGVQLGTESYHDLFKRLCGYAGLRCKLIDGVSKAAGYKPGMSLMKFRNQWTAVYVDDAWRFINCNWGARHAKNSSGDLTYEVDEFYFLTDPEDHIYQHLPDDPEWQLLEIPVSKIDFQSLPVVKSPFFNQSLTLTGVFSGLLTTDQFGNVQVRLRSPKRLNIAGKLERLKNSLSRPSQNAELENRTFVVLKNSNEYVVQARPPTMGKFLLEIYVESEWMDGELDAACSFLVKSNIVAPHANITFPPVGLVGSLTPKLKEFSHKDAYIACNNASCKIRVLMNTEIEDSDHLSLKFRLWDSTKNRLIDRDKFALIVSRDDRTIAIEALTATRAIYLLSIFVNGECSFKYLIENYSNAEPKIRPFPKPTKRWPAIGCELRAPLTRYLPANNQVRFDFLARNAKRMVISIGEDWVDLIESRGTWTGQVQTDKQGNLIIYASFDGRKLKPLLEYTVQTMR
ncbi:unnamed protein product [Dimorphilus gyrociliatus]|uniref:LIM zinc-binding domain-containing protein n=1 Tax=Dimorphilus gyrociliatus TaxID=2664684 RepID=A0A7I8VM57_9ANNE|nr:unnamed protein product [Dimorphilus gyrociliatus]